MVIRPMSSYLLSKSGDENRLLIAKSVGMELTWMLNELASCFITPASSVDIN